MDVTREDVKKVARLAKLKISEDEIEIFTGQFNTIIEYIHTLDELDTSQVEPTSHVLDLKNILREDAMAPSLPRGEMLKNAPQQDGEYFRVPKVIG